MLGEGGWFLPYKPDNDSGAAKVFCGWLAGELGSRAGPWLGRWDSGPLVRRRQVRRLTEPWPSQRRCLGYWQVGTRGLLQDRNTMPEALLPPPPACLQGREGYSGEGREGGWWWWRAGWEGRRDWKAGPAQNGLKGLWVNGLIWLSFSLCVVTTRNHNNWTNTFFLQGEVTKDHVDCWSSWKVRGQ